MWRARSALQERLQRLSELLQRKGLGEEGVPVPDGAGAAVGVAVAGDEQHLDRRTLGTKLHGELCAPDPRHHHIGDQHVDLAVVLGGQMEGVIADVLVENTEPVEFGQPLFKVEIIPS